MNEADAIVCDVETTMKYVVRGEKATFHAGDRSKSYWPVDEHPVTIHDVRPIRDRLSFERNGFTLLQLAFENGEPAIKYEHDDVVHEVALEDFRNNLRERVRAELSHVARQESRNAIDLGHVAQADALFAKRDYTGVKELLGTWPAALTIFLRTPEAQALQAETRGTLAHALGLLGSMRSSATLAARLHD